MMAQANIKLAMFELILAHVSDIVVLLVVVVVVLPWLKRVMKLRK